MLLHFTCKFWWILVHFRLSTIKTDNVLTWERSALVASFLLGYKIDFSAVISLEIHVYAFAEIITLPFLSLV